MRKNMTPHEKRLWYDYLSRYPVRFQRQKVIGNYIVDFYCHKAMLAIELDGSQHYIEQAVKYDANRTKYLSKMGVKTLRILNVDIDRNFEAVCTLIDNTVKDRLNKGSLREGAGTRSVTEGERRDIL